MPTSEGFAKSTDSKESEYSARESLLTRYFSEMVAHQVMSPDEELECAKALEQAELGHWTALLAYVPVAESILERLVCDVNETDELERPDISQAEELQSLVVVYRKQKSKLNVGQLKCWNERSTALARGIRLFDREREWLAHALEIAEGRGEHHRDNAERHSFAKTPAYASYIAHVHRTASRQLEVKNRFIRANLRLVVSIARRHNHGRMPLDDLIQEGNIGLIKAIDRFDYERGYRFSTYASWWIRHNIARALADKGRAVRVPVHMLDVIKIAAVAATTIVARTGHEPTLDELAADTGISKQRLLQARESAAATTLSLDRPIGEDEGSRHIDLLVDKDALSPFDGLARQNWLAEVQRLLGTLTQIETRIIRWRFGLDDGEELTLKEIGNKYGLSRERIRQLQEQALRKMRKQTGDTWR